MKLIDLKRFHVFRMDNKLYLLSDNYIGRTDDCSMRYQFSWNRMYRDGRTALEGKYTTDFLWLSETEVEDLGDLYDYMKKNHPIRYKRENWDEYRYDRWDADKLLINTTGTGS